MPDPIAVFEGEIVRVKTMADGSPRFEFGSDIRANQYLTPLADTKADMKAVMVIVYTLDDWERMEAEAK
jgi:hypothetical protein